LGLLLDKELTVNIFDKICAVLAFLLGGTLLVLGALGLFTGCKAHFTLPPILGVLPALVGWGIIKPIIVAWKSPAKARFAPGLARGIDDFGGHNPPGDNAP